MLSISPRLRRLLPALALCAAPLAAQSSSDIKDEVDFSLRWLRAQQDANSGAYGDVSGTAWALRTFIESPRAYVPSDGPFLSRAIGFLSDRQREDGAIVDADSNGDDALLTTALAARALGVLPEGTATSTLTAALGFLGQSETPQLWDPGLEGAEPAVVGRVVQALLAERSESGAWDDGSGDRITATSRALLELSAGYRVLKSAESGGDSGEPGEASALPRFDPASAARITQAIERGAAFLVELGPNGRWGAPGDPDLGLTAMCLSALQAVPQPRAAEIQHAIDAGLAWLVAHQHEDGAIHQGRLQNYATSASIMALAQAGRPEHAPVIARARGFLQTLQADEGEGYSEGDRFYGGVGYGGDERPDLSNMQMALEALVAAGVGSDDPTMVKAITFLERCQNRSESNTLVVRSGEARVLSGDDGGAGYAPGDSKAGFIELANGDKITRSYGSMTYALLKSLIFAGVDAEDPRVQAAWGWIQRNYTLDINPGFEGSSDPLAPYQGLFYYFQTMARTLQLLEVDTLTDAAGVEHQWRSELGGRLLVMQRQDGSWLNANSPRWWEGNPILATAYALQALQATIE